ncbi:DUF2865 domain-containing protein [Aquabacter sp. L1I39]|uniref:DUF2865 domain-containing protein n=1 Tax=Aquabacter sp. L1I39 TaxID=2820278 RepID=UPI001AD95835|nr:DUF2865 domain-containing protein [Aquabacter sp. L1I39]QTL05503.1 DUF2865 domain-containing protein [Aquabacter sp. L1I39]
MTSLRLFGLGAALLAFPVLTPTLASAQTVPAQATPVQLAQAPSYQVPPGAVAQAPGPNCMQLEGALASLDRPDPATDARLQQAAKMRGDLAQLNADAKAMNCDAPRGFFIFQGPPRPPQCDAIDDQISRLRANLASIERTAGGGDRDGQRRQIIMALAQNNCGPQYRAAAQAMAQPQRQQQRPRNFFEALFGGPGPEDSETAPGLDVAPMDLPKSSTYRTVCVRTCDGFYFPISYATVPARFATDDALCRRLCPATEAQLFTYRNPGEDIQQATSINGKPYMSLPTALLYRKQFNPSCSCRAPGQSWAQALAGLEDSSTLQKGDILVTEEQAKEMSQPRPVGDPNAKGKTASSRPASTAPASASGAAPLDPAPSTASAPLAPASEQPGQRPVRVIGTPRSNNASSGSTSATQ